jgi:signal transduction histidine kinase
MNIHYLLKPPIFEGEDKTRIAGLLHMMLLCLIVFLSAYTLIQILRGENTDLSSFLAANGTLIALSVGLLIFMRRGYVRAAGVCFMLFSWIDITAQAWLFGGTRDASFAAYGIVIVASGLLLGRWLCISFAALSVIAGWSLAYAETAEIIGFAPDPPYMLWIDHSLNFVLLTTVVVLITNSLNAALERARRDERELAAKNRELQAIRASLEERVAERTQQLADQNAQLQQEIDERQQAQAALQEALDREHKMLEDVRLNLSLALPHELRTPLSSILGLSEILLQSQPLPAPDRIMKYADGIHQGAVRLQRLVENTLLYANLRFLQYAQRESNHMHLEMSHAIKGVIISLAQQCARTARRHDDLVLGVVDDRRIRIIPEHLRKILTELFDNAFKFSKAGTSVRITTKVSGPWYTLNIEDQGRGMTAEQMRAVEGYMQFERRLYEQQGMGLGLIIASLLTQLERGTLTIESEKGQGTVVHLTFACETEPSVQ